MAAKYTEYYVQLIDARTKSPIDDDAGIYNVLTAGDPSEVTVYSNAQGSSGTNPTSMTDGIIQFWTASSTTSVDLSILTENGHAVFVEGLTPSQHRVEIDPEKIEQTFIVFYTANTASNSVIDTGFDLPNGAQVKDVYMHATDTATVGGFDVGTSTDPNGFLDLALCSTTGWKNYGLPIWTSPTASAYYVSAVQVRGALLLTHHTGDVATATGGGNHGQWAKHNYTVPNATSGAQLVYTLVATNSGGTGKGYIYVTYDRAPTQGN